MDEILSIIGIFWTITIWIKIMSILQIDIFSFYNHEQGSGYTQSRILLVIG